MPKANPDKRRHYLCKQIASDLHYEIINACLELFSDNVRIKPAYLRLYLMRTLILAERQTLAIRKMEGRAVDEKMLKQLLEMELELPEWSDNVDVKTFG